VCVVFVSNTEEYCAQTQVNGPFFRIVFNDGAYDSNYELKDRVNNNELPKR